MISLGKLRSSNAAHLGQVLTLEIACAIELSANDRDDHAISPGQFTAVAYKGVVLQDESFRGILNELHEAHYRETELHRSGIPLNMNSPALCESDRIEALIQFTARDSATGKLVGNCRMYLHRSLHTQTNAVSRRGHDFHFGSLSLRLAGREVPALRRGCAAPAWRARDPHRYQDRQPGQSVAQALPLSPCFKRYYKAKHLRCPPENFRAKNYASQCGAFLLMRQSLDATQKGCK